jgi:periplasmic protein TonB
VERVRQRDPVAATAYGRLGVALMLSVAFHVFLVTRPPAIGMRSLGPVQSPVIRARLEQPPPRTGQPLPSHASAADDAAREAGIAVPIPAEAVTAQPAVAEPSAAETSFALPDLVYHPAADLDVYPVPVSPILLAYPDSVRVAGVQGKVSLWVSIDETGWPAEVAIHDADPSVVFDEAALTALRGARFSPARKDGRPVRSRVLIELEFVRDYTN